MKRILPLLALCAPVLPARAEWTYDATAHTLTSGNTSVVLNNVYVWSGKQLSIGDNGNRSDLTVLDFTEGVADGYTIRTLVGKNTGDATRDGAFDNCPNLTTVITGDYPLDFGERAFDNCDALATVRIGKGLASIGWGAFRNCDGPMVVTFAEGSALATINSLAFSSCRNLRSIDLSNCTKLSTISGSAFENCSSLSSIDLSNSTPLASLGGSAFKNCSSLTTFALPRNCPLTTIEANVFDGCSALTALDLSVCPNLATIKEKAFLNNKALALVKLPASLTTLPIRAFDKHRSLAEGAAMLHVWFLSCPISDAKQNPFGEMFGNSKDYTVTDNDIANASVTIHVPRAQATAGTPNWNTWAGAWQALADNSGTWATDGTTPVFALPATADGTGLWVTDKAKVGVEWEDAAVLVQFHDDPVQVEISGPQYTGSFVGREHTTAEFSAIVSAYDTDAATHVTLSVTLFVDAAHTQPAASVSHDVTALGAATAFSFTGLAEDTTYYAVLSGVDGNGNAGDEVDLGSFRTKWDDVAWTYHPDRGTLEKGWIVVSNVTANGTALSVAKNSNNGDAELPDLDFTGGIRDGYELKTIGESAFANCTALTNVVLPATVTTVGSHAFRYDTALRSFAAPGPVSIGEYCFYENKAITNACLPNVVSLNMRCFQKCSALETVGTDLSTLTYLGQEALANCETLSGDFVMTNLTGVSSWLFNGSTGITSAVLGEGVHQILQNSFQGCDSLTNVVVKGELTKLEGGVFANHGPYNSHCSEPGHLDVYLTNVPDTLGNPFTSQYWSTMAGIDAADSTIVVHLPWYHGVTEGKNATDGTTPGFAAWAKAWQNEDVESIVARGCPATGFALPETKNGAGYWRNDVNYNTAAYVVRLAYYDDPNKIPAMTIILIK